MRLSSNCSRTRVSTRIRFHFGEVLQPKRREEKRRETRREEKSREGKQKQRGEEKKRREETRDNTQVIKRTKYQQSNFFSVTSLLAASTAGHSWIVGRLLRAGADPNLAQPDVGNETREEEGRQEGQTKKQQKKKEEERT